MYNNKTRYTPAQKAFLIPIRSPFYVVAVIVATAFYFGWLLLAIPYDLICFLFVRLSDLLTFVFSHPQKEKYYPVVQEVARSFRDTHVGLFEWVTCN
jgi:hypothetical protein